MKATHRSKELDALLNKKVKITFFDDAVIIGILIWNDYCVAPRYLLRASYYVKQSNGIYYRFRKSHIKRVEKI